MSCTNETLISFWPRTRIFSQFLQVWNAVTFDSPWSRVGHGLRPIFMLWLVKIWQESSCGKLMHHLGTCLLIAEVDRVLCHVVMFLTVSFHWMYTMKYSCFKDSSVIHVWFVYWVFGWEMRGLSKSLETRLRMASCSPRLMCKRVEKSQAVFALLDGFQELHLDW